MVLVVNMDSLNTNHVSMGKTRYPTEDPTNLADHTESMCSETSFHPYQKLILAGTPKSKADKRTLSDHQGLIFCRFN